MTEMKPGMICPKNGIHFNPKVLKMVTIASITAEWYWASEFSRRIFCMRVLITTVG